MAGLSHSRPRVPYPKRKKWCQHTIKLSTIRLLTKINTFCFRCVHHVLGSLTLSPSFALSLSLSTFHQQVLFVPLFLLRMLQIDWCKGSTISKHGNNTKYIFFKLWKWIILLLLFPFSWLPCAVSIVLTHSLLLLFASSTSFRRHWMSGEHGEEKKHHHESNMACINMTASHFSPFCSLFYEL